MSQNATSGNSWTDRQDPPASPVAPEWTEKKELLNSAMLEIRRLRRENEILHAKVEVMELFACVLHTTPAEHREGAAIDVAWQLQQAIDAL